MAQLITVPSGMRDFLPSEIARRNYIFDTIRSVFHTFGFMPIETPAMENLSVLLGKYGNEGDKLLYKVLNSGDAFAKITPDDLTNSNAASLKVCEKGLRYDLTVPFARYVAAHQNDITFPFRRYQIQTVWRADRPQRGRYREFYQCDADIVGSASLLNEAELLWMTDMVFRKLKIDVVIKINNRKVLCGIAELMGAPDKLTDITTAIDKIGKIGIDKVNEELAMRGIAQGGIDKLQTILQWQGSNEETLQWLATLLAESEAGMVGVQELQAVFDYLAAQPVHSKVALDLSLARGLNYYTGAIFEVQANDAAIGSICGGGRYDNLTSVFGLKNISGVGISFGADRIYDVMSQLDSFPQNIWHCADIMFVNLGKKEELRAAAVAQILRSKGIATEIYPESRKIQKQMEYANRRRIPYVGIIGKNELQQDKITIKDMNSGEQQLVSETECVNILTNKLLQAGTCPRCGSTMCKNGKSSSGTQRLRCRKCGKSTIITEWRSE
jgi:histidyl-tRNA synthetase